MWGALIGLGKSVVDSVTGIVTRRQKVKDAEAENRADLLRHREKNNSEWERKQLARSDNFSRRFIMFAVFAPIFITAGWPDRGKEIWDALDLVPREWWQLVSVVVASIYGVRGLMQAWEYRRNGKKAVADA